MHGSQAFFRIGKAANIAIRCLPKGDIRIHADRAAGYFSACMA